MKLIYRNNQLELASDSACQVHASLLCSWDPQSDDWSNQNQNELVERKPGRITQANLSNLKVVREISFVEKAQQSWNLLSQQNAINDTLFSIKYFAGIGRTGFTEQERVRQDLTAWLSALLVALIALVILTNSQQSASHASTTTLIQELSAAPNNSLTVSDRDAPKFAEETESSASAKETSNSDAVSENASFHDEAREIASEPTLKASVSSQSSYGQAPFILPEPAPPKTDSANSPQ